MKINAYAAMSAKSELVPFEYDAQPLGSQEVEVRVQYCGVCHSDLGMIDNDWGTSTYPLVPGHEVIGEVTSIGQQVTELKVGQRVGVGWQSGSCQVCPYCRRGKEHLCVIHQEETIVGRHGGWADSVRAQARFTVPIPDNLDSAIAGPLMCAGTTVWTPMTHYGVRPGMKTAVLGVGGLGHLAVQFLAKFGTDVTAMSSTHSKEEEARQLGASDFIATRGTDELAKAANRFDLIISTVSADVDWNQYIAALAPEGRLCIVGIPESELKLAPFPLIHDQRSVSGGRAGAPSDTAAMLEFCANHGVAPMCEQFEMKDVNRAVERVRSGNVRYRAVLVR
ncbi:MAG: NAD(P)-dependent alcohol dehydrogenase [Microcystaceae cyanobacterium]